MAGKEGIMSIAELAPGAAAGKHFHPGPEFAYIRDGSLTLEPQGQAPQTFKTGEVFHNPAKIVHDGKNASTTAPAKVLVFISQREGPAPYDPGAIAVTRLATSAPHRGIPPVSPTASHIQRTGNTVSSPPTSVVGQNSARAHWDRSDV